MKYFDTLINMQFLEDDEGNKLFFPRGIRKTGYVLDSGRKQEIEKFLKLQYWVVMIASILFVGVVGFVLPNCSFRWLVLVSGMGLLILGFLLWWRIATSKLVEGLPVTDYVPKISSSDRFGRVKVLAKSMNAFFLWFGQVTSLLFVVAGLYLITAGANTIGLAAGVFFFGLLSIFYCWLLIIRYRS